MLRRPAILLLCLLGHYSALTVGQNITIGGGLFAANEPVSVVTANPTATTVVGTTTVTITFSGSSTTGTQTGTITYTFVVGPSTAAYTEELPGLSATNGCVLTRSLAQGSCFFESTALNTDSGSTWYTLFETYTLATEDFNHYASYTVTGGQEKLLIVTTYTTAPSISLVTSASPPILTSNSSAVSATNITPITGLTPSLILPTASRAAMRHDTRCLSSAVVGLTVAVVVSMSLCF
jgi:hypothetical protein